MILSLFHKKYQQKFQKKINRSIIPNKYSCFKFSVFTSISPTFQIRWLDKVGRRKGMTANMF